MMQVTRVASSTLFTVAYDARRGVLQLEFHDRTVYQYLGVPTELYETLLQSPSKGKYFNRAIRGQFPCAPVPDAQNRQQEQERREHGTLKDQDQLVPLS